MNEATFFQFKSWLLKSGLRSPLNHCSSFFVIWKAFEKYFFVRLFTGFHFQRMFARISKTHLACSLNAYMIRNYHLFLSEEQVCQYDNIFSIFINLSLCNQLYWDSKIFRVSKTLEVLSVMTFMKVLRWFIRKMITFTFNARISVNEFLMSLHKIQGTVSTELLANRSKLCGHCVFHKISTPGN